MEVLSLEIDFFHQVLKEALSETWAVNLLEFVSVVVLSLTLFASLRAVRRTEETND